VLKRRTQRGVTFIELAIGLAIVAVLLVLALPNFTVFIQNTRIRNAAEAALSAMQLARAEAVRRNVQVAFVITNTVPAAANVSAVVPINTGRYWMVRTYQPGGVYTAADFIQGGELAAAAGQAQTNVQRTDLAGNPYASGPTSADVDTVIFTGLGRSPKVLNGGTEVTDFARISADFTYPAGGNCQHAATPGEMRCLRILVTAGGQIKMCDPKVPVNTPQVDPRECQ
jgi:type IV fimbrial biogenesis protein FimT